MKSFKTMDLPFNYKKFLDVSSNVSLHNQIKEKWKRKNPFHWTYASHAASFTFKNILYAYKDKL